MNANMNVVEESNSKGLITLSKQPPPLAQNKIVSNNRDVEYENNYNKDENIIKSLNYGNVNEIKCTNCYEIEKKLLKSEQKNVNLMFENKRLKDALNNATNMQQNLLHSCKKKLKLFLFIIFLYIGSAINPNNVNEENQNINAVSLQKPADFTNNESEELLNRIENLMVELTRMMDNLENINNNNVTNNNLTYQFTSSTSNLNNNANHLINSANNINFNSLLNSYSNNLSNIVSNINNNLANKIGPLNIGNTSNDEHFGNQSQLKQKENINKIAGLKQN